MPSERRPAAAAPPIEIDARGRSLLGMAPRRFLARYWQRHPLLVRRAIAGFRAPLTPEDLAGLACEPSASSRIVTHLRRPDRWRVRRGPFRESDFRKLPRGDWTLLVDDCDKLIADVDALLELFDFLPRWRLDDVMVSYAAPGGSVGAHVDQYDVFLLQGLGQRVWSISTDPDAPTAYRDDAELRILREFAPTHTWTLAPGDLLYLPPGVPHHGVADGPCMTFSVGARAPSVAELLLDVAEERGSELDDAWRYRDPGIVPTRDPARIGSAALAEVRRLLAAALDLDERAFADWFGGFITRYRSARAIAASADPRAAAAALLRLGPRRALHRNPWSRYAWTGGARSATLFHGGQRYEGSVALARLLQSRNRLRAEDLASLSPSDRDVVGQLVGDGHWVIDDA